MTYYESAEDTQLSKKEALLELKWHGITHPDDIACFLKEVGDKKEYEAQEVLDWLGY